MRLHRDEQDRDEDDPRRISGWMRAKLMEAILKHDYPQVRVAMAGNTNAPEEFPEALAKDPEATVAQEARLSLLVNEVDDHEKEDEKDEG